MKIIIHARGNSQIGIGNLSRSYELLSYLSKNHDVIGVFECDKNVYKKYENKNVLRSDNLINSVKLIKNFENSIYICDLIDPNKELSDNLKKNGVKKIIHFNGIEYGFEPDIIFIMNGFDYIFETKDIEVYKGFEYYIVGEEVVKNRKKNLTPIKKLENILICFGGADPAYYTEYFAEIINDKKYNYTIILGPAMSDERKIYIKSIKKENIRYIDNPLNIIELLLSSDLLVTLGGMITYEAMCLGIPASAVRWNNLEYVVKSFGEKNMIIDLENINDAYQNILNLEIDELNNTCKNAFNIVDGSALKNIKNILETILNKREYND